MRFRLVPKSTTLDDLVWSLRTLFQNAYVFGAHHENLNEDRPTLSAAPKGQRHDLQNLLGSVSQVLNNRAR